jgi:succinate dehydrogenase / fumarate reductase cytochrome b subunit
MAVRLSRTFILRKLHQPTGIVPRGAFLLEHFYTNSKALTGPQTGLKAVRPRR